jgi:DNA-directed RNA polymerase subunit E'/Rpb7
MSTSDKSNRKIQKSKVKRKINKNKLRKKGIWMRNILTRKILLPFNSVGSNIRENIKKTLEQTLYNKCSKEGYIKTKSIQILSYSSGVVEANTVVFDVMFECDICRPVEGQIINCKVKNITRAGIRATYTKEEDSPITIFVARDHHYNNEEFSQKKEDDDISIKVIGIRYELNDETISVLGELIMSKKKPKTKVTIIGE